MSKIERLNARVSRLLTAAVEEVLEVVKDTASEYQEKTARTQRENDILQRKLQELQQRFERELARDSRTNSSTQTSQSVSGDPRRPPETSCKTEPRVQSRTTQSADQPNSRLSPLGDSTVEYAVSAELCVFTNGTDTEESLSGVASEADTERNTTGHNTTPPHSPSPTAVSQDGSGHLEDMMVSPSRLKDHLHHHHHHHRHRHHQPDTSSPQLDMATPVDISIVKVEQDLVSLDYSPSGQQGAASLSQGQPFNHHHNNQDESGMGTDSESDSLMDPHVRQQLQQQSDSLGSDPDSPMRGRLQQVKQEHGDPHVHSESPIEPCSLQQQGVKQEQTDPQLEEMHHQTASVELPDGANAFAGSLPFDRAHTLATWVQDRAQPYHQNQQHPHPQHHPQHPQHHYPPGREVEREEDQPQAQQRELRCKLCNQTFCRPGDLRVHLQCHKRPHPCSHCGRRFSHAGYLEAHMHTHVHAARQHPYAWQPGGKTKNAR